MCMHQLESIKECLINQVHAQLAHIDQVDTEELGEVVDMIKDIAKAEYYCTVVEAMEKSNEESEHTTAYYRDMDRGGGRMYYSSGNFTPTGHSSSQSHGSWAEHDAREGRSHMSRKNYMESKEMHRDKETQVKELEKYISELTSDITEMIEGASQEEKQLLQRKISTLATKIV